MKDRGGNTSGKKSLVIIWEPGWPNLKSSGSDDTRSSDDLEWKCIQTSDGLKYEGKRGYGGRYAYDETVSLTIYRSGEFKLDVVHVEESDD